MQKMKCDDCGGMVEVADGKFAAHKKGEEDCPGGGKDCPTEKTDVARVRRFERIDFSSSLPKPQKTADGFWAVSGHVARTGVQEYRDSKGGIRRELRLPEDVAASLPSFALQPLTNDHPPVMVEPGNAEKYVAGAVGDAKMDGGWVVAPLKIYTADAIAAVEGGRVQLSVGYSCRLDYGAGEWEGQKYDATQREIVVNHVALVDFARAGVGASLRLDAGDAIAVVCDTTGALASNQENRMPHELRIDGLVFQVTDPNAQAAYDRALKQREDAKSEAVAQNATAQSVAAQAVKDKDTAQAKADNAASELKQIRDTKISRIGITVAEALDEAKCDAALTSVVQAAAAARAALLVEARKHLGANEVFDAHKDAKSGKDVPAKSDLEIKRLVVEKLDSSVKLDGKSEDYVQARYDGLVEAAGKKVVAPLAQLRAAVTPQPGETPREDAAPTDAAAARKAFEAKMIADNLGNQKRN